MKSKITDFLYKYSWYYRLYVDNKVDKIQFAKVYDDTPHEEIISKDVVFILSGKAHLWAFDIHGGFADRLKGIVSVYEACKESDRNFKIVHTYPYLLEKFLVPNQYDWKIDSDAVVYNIHAVTPYYFRHSHYKDEASYFRWRARRLLTGNKCLHIYSNAVTVNDDEFRTCFNELFKPSPSLEREIDLNLSNIGCNYISLSYRFTHLLGDPVDTYMKELSAEEKEALIDQTLSSIIAFHNKYPNHKILVNSDSNTFLSRVKEASHDYVYIIPGVPVHIDQVTDASDESYMKTFIDFFMISKADRVFLVKAGEMRNSGFPKCAAIIGNKPFEIVNI